MLVASPLDLQKNELRQAQIQNLASAPGSPVKGQMYYDTTTNKLYWWNGTSWVDATGGAAAAQDATASQKGVIQLAGDIAGTAAAPVVAPLAITDAKVAAANKDGAAGTPGMRSLGPGGFQAMPGNYTINDVGPPYKALALNGKQITGLADPTLGTDGATKQYVDGKTPADATTGVKGIVQLAGDLAGTAASPQIAAGVITDAEVAAANKDGLTATPSMRTLGYTGAKAMPGATTLDAIPAAQANVSLNFFRAYNLGDPLSPYDAATKNYVDTVAQGLDAKQSVKAASTVNVDISTGGAQTVDGVPLIVGDRCLLKNETLPENNGIWIVAGGTWTRAADMDNWAEFPGAFVFVERGTVNADTGWVCTADQGGTLNATAVTWTQFSGAGSFTDGIGLLKTGNILDVRLDNTTIEAPSDILQVKASGITASHLAAGSVVLNSSDVTGSLPIANGGTGGTTAAEARGFLNAPGVYATTNTAGTTTTILYSTHQVKSSRNLVVLVRLISTGEEVMVDNTVNSNGDVVVTFATSQTGATYSIFITG